MSALLLAVLLCAPAQAEPAKKALILVAPAKKDQAWLSPELLEKRHEDEKKYLESQGYEVSVETASRQAVLAALSQGVGALSYFGPGAKDKEGRPAASLAGLDALAWKLAAKAKGKSGNFGLTLVRNFSCYSLRDRAMAELFVRPGGHYFGADSEMTKDPSYDKLAGLVRGCNLGGECACEAMGQYSAADLKDYPLPVASPIAGTWYIKPSGTFEVSQDGDKVSWVLSVPERRVRAEGKGAYSGAMLNGAFEDTEDPAGLKAGEYSGWQVTSEGKLCGMFRWWKKGDITSGRGRAFDCYTRQP